MSLCRLKRVWSQLQSWPRWRRWPFKGGLFLVVVFLTLYPDPRLFYRHITHFQQADSLPSPDGEAISALSGRLDKVVAGMGDGVELLAAVEAFVYEEGPYGWDWEVWGVVDYLPSVEEVIREGREDCDGRAVLAAALLRGRGIDARLVGDLRHMWVRTPFGDTMNPLGKPAFRVTDERVEVDWSRLLDVGPLGFGVAVFPLVRETIILLTAWVLVLPSGIRWRSALLGLMLVFSGLFAVRFAGADPLVPQRWGIGLGLVWVLVGLVVAAVFRSDAPNKTDRSVCEIEG